MRKRFDRFLKLLLVMLVGTVLTSGGLTATLLWPILETGHRTPAAYGLPFEPVTFTPPTGSVLQGWFIPNAQAHGRTVVVLHGISANKSIFVERGVDIQKLGYNVVMIDLRRHGESTGWMTTYGYEESQEVAWVVDRLLLRPDVDKHGVAVVGFSLGGAVALQTLPYSTVRAVVADSAFTDLHSIMTYRGQQWHLPAFLEPMCEWEVSVVAPFHVDQVSPLACLSHSQKPVLVISGTADRSVPVQMGRALAQAGDPHTDFWEVPDAAHLEAFHLDHPEYMQRIGTFLQHSF